MDSTPLLYQELDVSFLVHYWCCDSLRRKKKTRPKNSIPSEPRTIQTEGGYLGDEPVMAAWQNKRNKVCREQHGDQYVPSTLDLPHDEFNIAGLEPHPQRCVLAFCHRYRVVQFQHSTSRSTETIFKDRHIRWVKGNARKDSEDVIDGNISANWY